MGLDIGVYKTMRKLSVKEYEEEGGYKVAENFTEQAKSLNSRSFYEPMDELFSFRAGSYSGYNQWRLLLCKFAHGVDINTYWDDNEKYKGSPFRELIYFSDCEGVIDSEVSEKLYHDFVDGEEKVLKKLKDNYGVDYYAGMFRKTYNDFKEAFKLASENKGFVVFH